MSNKKRSKGKHGKAQARPAKAAVAPKPSAVAPSPSGKPSPSSKAAGVAPAIPKPAPSTKPASAKAAKSAPTSKAGKSAARRSVTPAAPVALTAAAPAPSVTAPDVRAPRAAAPSSPADLPRATIVGAASSSYSIAPTLGWFAVATVVAIAALDGDLDAVLDLLHRSSKAAVVGTPGVGAGPGTATEVPPPPLPPAPDLAPTAPTVAGTPPVPQPGVNVEEPCAAPGAAPCPRYALDTVYRALAQTEAGTATRPVRIEFYGDSVSAADAIPGRLRARLQGVFGDGGPGFLHAVAPHRFNYSTQVERSSSGDWNVHSVVSGHVADDLYGLGLSTVEGRGTLRFRLRDPERSYAHVELAYLAQPGGGAADLVVDGEVAASVDTASEARVPAYQPLRLADGAHKLDLKTTRGKVRLFGVTFERERGVVVDNLAVVSATAENLQNNQAEHWRAQLAHREPDLVVFMLGTNEAQWIAGGKAMSEYEQHWSQLLATIRAGRPEASCLVISPLDQAETRDGSLVPRRAMPRMIATQRRAAVAAGCAFWDSFTWMGGSGAAIKWNQRGLLGSDFAHPSPQGMAKVADAVADALFTGFRAYKGRTTP